MPRDNDQYLRLHYPEYKSIETQLLRFACQQMEQHGIPIPDSLAALASEWPDKVETTHRTVEGGYHKAIRIRITETLIYEFQGPLVKSPHGPNVGGYGHAEEKPDAV